MSSTRSSLGAPGPRGFRGTQGIQGNQGPIGDTGPQGPTGAQGANISILNDLQDVVITDPENGQTLIFATGAGSDPDVWINGRIPHTSIDLSTLPSYSGSTAANEALGIDKPYLLIGDDCLRITEATGI